tara:strand:- start:10164 stop:10961 length:798 start_codon:yes stop_codon:yes gene_type:complete
MKRPKKSLGQNFLIDKNIINKIILSVNPKNKNIIEIGPGTGNLTKEIIKKNPSSLVLIEKDENLCLELKKKFNKKKVQVLNDDILSLNLENLIKENSIIVGNLPYNIASQILVKFIKFSFWPPKFNRIVFMFQKEVGEKIILNNKKKDYGRLRILSNYRLNIIKSFNVSKNCFYPKPKVESKVIVFKPKINKNYKIQNIKTLEKITHTFFSNKRKMINKAFKSTFKNYLNVSKKLNIDLLKRPSDLSEDDYYRIAELYEKNIKKI